MREHPDPNIKWQDLRGMSWLLITREILLPLPWLALSVFAFSSPYWPLGMLPAFMLFLSALRLNHEAIHSNLDLPRWADNLILHVLSVLLMASNHAVAHSHMIHHRHLMGPDDYEGHCGEMTFLQVLLYGPKFPFDLTRHALIHASAKRKRRVILDWVLIVAYALAVAIYAPVWMQMFVGFMALGQCMTAFFAVWITHHGAHANDAAARSQRGPFAWLAYLMFYHREHHLFPAVPVHQLPKLAARLDAQVPGYKDHHMPVIALFDRKGS